MTEQRDPGTTDEIPALTWAERLEGVGSSHKAKSQATRIEYNPEQLPDDSRLRQAGNNIVPQPRRENAAQAGMFGNGGRGDYYPQDPETDPHVAELLNIPAYERSSNDEELRPSPFSEISRVAYDRTGTHRHQYKPH